MVGDLTSVELEPIWLAAADELRRALPAPTFDLWLRPLRPLSFDHGVVFMAAPKASRVWVERRYGAAVEAALSAAEPAVQRVAFVVADDSDPRPEPERLPRSLPLDPRHTFERFVIGPGNRLAHAAALAVAESPGEAYNPLFLHGPPGLGKTHLLGAVADYLHRRQPQLRVHLTTAELFTSDFVGALRQNGPERFKELYRGLDALLIDDVQALEGKPRTEEEFVHTFNALHRAGKQMVLSSDRPPEALATLAERLRDRFQWGLCVAVEPPDRRTRAALVWRIAAEQGDQEPPAGGLVQRIADRAAGNVRALEGLMTRIAAYSSLLREPISEPIVDRALHPAGEPTPGAPRPGSAGATPSLDEITGAVCAALHLSRDDLLSSRRTSRAVRARQLSMYLARELTSLSFAQIARHFHRDHSTVVHAVRAIATLSERDTEARSLLERLRGQLSAGPVLAHVPGGAIPSQMTSPQAGSTRNP